MIAKMKISGRVRTQDMKSKIKRYNLILHPTHWATEPFDNGVFTVSCALIKLIKTKGKGQNINVR